MSNKVLTDTGAVCLTSPNNAGNGSAVASAQLVPSSAVTIFAVSGVICKSKNRASTAGETSSFPANALGEIAPLFGEKEKLPLLGVRSGYFSS
jgi:hypothetical protein